MSFNLDTAAVVQLLISTVLPLLVGLVTTRVTIPGVKAVLLAALSLVTSLLVAAGDAIATSATFDLGAALLAALPTFLVAVGMHYGLWKPSGATGVVADVGHAVVPADSVDGTEPAGERFLDEDGDGLPDELPDPGFDTTDETELPIEDEEGQPVT